MSKDWAKTMQRAKVSNSEFDYFRKNASSYQVMKNVCFPERRKEIKKMLCCYSSHYS